MHVRIVGLLNLHQRHGTDTPSLLLLPPPPSPCHSGPGPLRLHPQPAAPRVFTCGGGDGVAVQHVFAHADLGRH